MRIVKRVLSTYSADNFGVCSALYELGGLVVMHDASGCNSTYNTHDEPRWYDMDSMVFISGLTEKDAIFGNDEILVRNLCETAEKLQPFLRHYQTILSHFLLHQKAEEVQGM